MSQPAPAQVHPPLVTMDDEEQKKLNQIATHLTQATNTHHNTAQVTPAMNQSAMPSWAHSQALEQEESVGENEPEIVDIIKGFQGRMRTGSANDFLNSKMKWLSKKHKGADVGLK